MNHNDKVICTIIAKNYLAYARTWAKNISKYEPDAIKLVLIIDFDTETEKSISNLDFITVSATDLGLQELTHFFTKYDVLEASTAIKPYFISYIFNHYPVTRIIYLDPDIVLFNNLSDAWDLLNQNTVVLTPHIVFPLDPNKNVRPNERDYLRLGCANLGFIGISRTGQYSDVLLWWQQKLYTECTREQESGVFLDQRWADIMPFIFDKVHILRNPAYNVAWWNLTERPITIENGVYKVYGQQLVFFHYSGYSPINPDRMTHHISSMLVSDFSLAIQSLYKDFSDQLTANNYSSLRQTQYKYDFFGDGSPVSYIFRLCLRKYDLRGEKWKNPISIDSNCFLKWITTPLKGRLLSLYALMLYDRYYEIQEAFPALDQDGEKKYLNWLFSYNANGSYDFHQVYIDPLKNNVFFDTDQKDMQTMYPKSLTSIPFFDRCVCGKSKPGKFS